MRSRFLLALALALAVVPAAGARTRMPLRCCLELDLPDVPPGPICAELKSRRPRLAQCPLHLNRPRTVCLERQ